MRRAGRPGRIRCDCRHAQAKNDIRVQRIALNTADAAADVLNARRRGLGCVCGHIHEAYGVAMHHGVTVINAATCTTTVEARHPPIVFDIPLDAQRGYGTCGAA